MLTREEARQLVLNRLRRRDDGLEYCLEDHLTVERPFGWLFLVAVSASSAPAQVEADSHRLIIVNKHVEQVIGTSIDYTQQRFIETYEALLGESQMRGREWCLTVSFPLPWKYFRRQRLAKKARDIGFYEIK